MTLDDKAPTHPHENQDSTPAAGNEKGLADAERLKIRLEEQFRIEIRKQLEEKKSNQPRLWAFINSSFGLWLMSAILVTWAGTIYTQWQSRRADSEKSLAAQTADFARNKELVERLDLEISHRFSEFQIDLVYLVNDWGGKSTRYTFRSGKSEKDVRKAIDSLLQPPQNDAPILYPEFSKMGTLALITELRRHVPAKEQEDLDHVTADLSGIYVFLDVKKIKTDDVYAVGNAVFKTMVLPRWRAGQFYFSDCPFC